MKKIQTKLASEIYKYFDLEKEAQALIDPAHTPQQFLQVLIEAKQYYDAVNFLAHALPKRESVWWACICSRATVNDKTSEDNIKALKVAEQWVYNPTEENRRLAEKMAEKTEYVSPPSWTAMAAFWSGGSITAVDEPPVPPAKYLYANAVAGAVNLSATIDKNLDTEKLYLQFLKQGMDIADGGNGEAAA